MLGRIDFTSQIRTCILIDKINILQMVRVRISKLGIFLILVEIGELFAKAKSVYLLQGKRYSSRKKREFYLSISIFAR